MPALRIARTGAPLLLVVAVLLGGCASTPPPSTPSDPGLVRADGVSMRAVSLRDAAALEDVVDATRALGVTALESAPRDDNAVVSPSSLAMALAMLAEGARGTSLADLERVLGASDDDRRDVFAALRAALLELDGDPAAATAGELPERPIVHVADQVVIDDEFEVDAEYLEALADGFDAGVQYTDLGSNAGKSVFDEWVKHHTGGLIEESAIEPNDDLRLVLQDAILLAARWQTPFQVGFTHAAPFTLADGATVDVDTMTLPGGALAAYVEIDGWRAARLPYVEALHADLLLPPEGTDPADLTPELLARISHELDAAAAVPIGLAMPVLDLRPDALDLLPLLPELGLSSLLCRAPDTDLSGIALDPGELCLQQAKQTAVLQVDEDGTVGAAVTELGVAEASAPVVTHVVLLDRPFAVTVSHTDTGLPLFLAAVRDP